MWEAVETREMRELKRKYFEILVIGLFKLRLGSFLNNLKRENHRHEESYVVFFFSTRFIV